MILLVVGAVSARAVATPNTAGFDLSLASRVFSAALAFAAPRVLDPVTPETLALWGLHGISALDPALSADLIAGKFGEVNYKVIPSVIYTAPEIAWVGQTEEQVKASGRPYKVGVFPFAASGRARAMEAGQGMAKVVSASDDDEVLGIHVIGPMAGELIGEATLAMEYSASTEDIQRTIHAHPTLSEAIHEAALAADKKAIDSINR